MSAKVWEVQRPDVLVELLVQAVHWGPEPLNGKKNNGGAAISSKRGTTP